MWNGILMITGSIILWAQYQWLPSIKCTETVHNQTSHKTSFLMGPKWIKQTGHLIRVCAWSHLKPYKWLLALNAHQHLSVILNKIEETIKAQLYSTTVLVCSIACQLLECLEMSTFETSYFMSTFWASWHASCMRFPTHGGAGNEKRRLILFTS
jgi:hypothetical protein